MNPIDASFWDQQFHFASILPDFQYWLDTMGEQSQAFTTSHPAPEYLAYGRHARQWVELYSFADATRTIANPHNTVMPVFIHGGYWRALSAEMHRAFLKGLSGLGETVANIEYRLIPEVRLMEVVEDITSALLCLVEHVGKSRQLLLTGHSAGGHLALCAALDQRLQPHIAAVVPVSGIYDLSPLPYSFLQKQLALDENDIARASPLPHIASGSIRSPVLPIVGALETFEFQRQAEMLAAKIQTSVLRISGAHHMNVLQLLTQTDNPLTKTISRFLAGKAIVTMLELKNV